MIWIIAIVVGGLVGWLASISYRGTQRQNVLLNILIGTIGGLFGIWLFFGVFGIITASAAANFWLGILWALIGSVVFMAITEAVYLSKYEREEPMGGKTYPYEYREYREERRKKEKRDKEE